MNEKGPAATVELVRKLVLNAGAPVDENVGIVVEAKAEETQGDVEADKKEPEDATNGSGGTADGAQADVAAEVADTAEKLDGDAGV